MRKQSLFILLLLMSFCSMMRAQTSFTYGGLNYTVLSEADGTAIVGKQDASLSGDVIIRNTVRDSSTELYYTVVAVGDSAFLDTKITSVTFPSSDVIKSIGARAFKNCKELSSFTIPSSVTTIGEAAMAHCDALTSITIPDGLTSIGFTAFSSCESLSQIVVEAGNTVYDSRNGCNALIETATNTLLTGCKNTYIYNSITSIADNAFKDCVGLTVINIPESVESIGERAFQGCENLQSINIPSSITSISNNTFNGCKALTSIILPEKLNSIGDYALNGCAGLTSLVIPAGVSSIGQNALANCTGLKWVVVKDGVSDIAVGADAFSGIIVEGILIFENEALRDLMDIRIFVDTDADIRLCRRVKRDVNKRGRSLESVLTQYQQTVKPMYEKYVEPSKKYADIVVPEGGKNLVALAMIQGYISRYLEGMN